MKKIGQFILFILPLVLIITGALINIMLYSFLCYIISATLFGVLIKESSKWW